MAEADGAERTEPATQKRRDQARKRGEVAQSRDLSGAILLGAGFLLIGSGAGEGLLAAVGTLASASWSGAWIRPGSLLDYHAVLLEATRSIGLAALPLAGGLLLVGVLAPLVQTGPMLAPEALEMRWSKLDPLSGMRRLVSGDRLFDLAKSLVKLAVIGAIVWRTVEPSVDEVLAMGAAPLPTVLAAHVDLGRRITAAALAALFALGLIDFAYTRWRHEEKLKMTRQEVRDEMRQSEGSPETRMRVRAAQRELSQARMLAAVADANVIVRNPTHFAVALKYDRGRMAAPVVVAKGRNKVALRIIAAGERHGVPIVENRPIARLLYQTVELGREIPESLYEVVAEILATVMRADRRYASLLRSPARGAAR